MAHVGWTETKSMTSNDENDKISTSSAEEVVITYTYYLPNQHEKYEQQIFPEKTC